MGKIKNKIEQLNNKEEKALTVFLTSGFPNVNNFVDSALEIINAGADILEIGLPFGDSLADGPVIQASYIDALKQNVNLKLTLEMISKIREQSETPLILMSSANPILNYGKRIFVNDAIKAGVNGVIIPDVPLEEYNDFFENSFEDLDTIMLSTPTSPDERIKKIDEKSRGFLYCVSIVGTTGVRNRFDSYVLQNLERTYKLVDNKMQLGFGISSPEDVKRFSPYCDGVIVGSAIIKSLRENKNTLSNTVKFVKDLKSACKH